MAALTAPYDTHSKDGELIAYPIAANTTIFKGALVEIVGGFAQPGADTAGAAFAGVAHETKINTAATLLPNAGGPAGAAGALKVRVDKTGSLLYNKAAAVAADIGKQAFIVDDNTVSTAPTANNLSAGYVVEVPDAAHVRVRINRSVQ
jgi:hypothetical protein